MTHHHGTSDSPSVLGNHCHSRLVPCAMTTRKAADPMAASTPSPMAKATTRTSSLPPREGAASAGVLSSVPWP